MGKFRPLTRALITRTRVRIPGSWIKKNGCRRGHKCTRFKSGNENSKIALLGNIWKWNLIVAPERAQADIKYLPGGPSFQIKISSSIPTLVVSYLMRVFTDYAQLRIPHAASPIDFVISAGFVQLLRKLQQ